MYDWERNKSMTAPLSAGQLVVLNPQWSTYHYLKQHFGHLFPALVGGISGDVVTIERGSKRVTFARQVLASAR